MIDKDHCFFVPFLWGFVNKKVQNIAKLLKLSDGVKKISKIVNTFYFFSFLAENGLLAHYSTYNLYMA